MGTERYTPSRRERDEVRRLDGDQRYVYFVKRVVFWGAAFGLADATGWALVGGEDGGSEAVALWPALDYARDAANGSWARFEPRTITTDELLQAFLPRVRERGLRVAVLPVVPGGGTIVSADALETSVQQEAARRG